MHVLEKYAIQAYCSRKQKMFRPDKASANRSNETLFVAKQCASCFLCLWARQTQIKFDVDDLLPSCGSIVSRDFHCGKIPDNGPARIFFFGKIFGRFSIFRATFSFVRYRFHLITIVLLSIETRFFFIN